MQERYFPRTIKILMAGALALKLSGCMQPPEPVRTTTTPVIVKQPADKKNEPAPRVLTGPITATWTRSCPTITWKTSGVTERWQRSCDGVPQTQNTPAQKDAKQAKPQADAVEQAEKIFELPEEVGERVKLLKHRDPWIREAIAVALGEFRDAQAIDALAESLAKDKEPKVRLAALKSLWRILIDSGTGIDAKKFQKVTNSLLMALDDQEEPVRREAEEHLLPEHMVEHLAGFAWKIKSARTTMVNSMIRALRSPNRTVRRVAAGMLGELTARNALAELKKIRDNDQDKDVRAAAAQAIKAITHGRWPESPGTGGPAER